ncbi:ataxin-2-like protein isoform X17 [Mesoplodon densirostris]|uniref:ataxin-2-like protein isoform X17 n=1 Tax=Mesoplodon densirostris TaxID=48708 RepID=UPI0028DB4BB7|nr:ataxin-2-like protein isoform X17 [Mesoplodon densirostris]XP_059934981.1 ataxin-2-like protein isoform X17 [Mesoplodon densirostris]
MLKPQPPQQTSQPQQPPPTQQAVARRPPGGTSPPNGGLPGPLASTSAPPGPPAAASPCLGPAAAAGSGLRRGAEGILAPPPQQQQHQERPGAAAIGSARGQSTGKGPPQSPVFEGVYNNSRMLHFLTAVVGSTCDVKVKNGTTYEGIFKTLSSKFELAVDAVHRKALEPAGGPRREDIVDTMVFKPSDVMLVHFRNVDFNYATKDKFTDSAIAMNSKVNGEHKEKVLQRWEGGDSNSDDYDLESDMSNGWDPNEMFKFNEENYGVKTTYDSSLSSYTVPLEKDNSEEFRQRELRAAQLAREIESSPQYRLRIAMENDDGRTEEEKHSAVQRQGSGRESPSLASREGKYIPLPQRVREGPRGGVRCSSSRGGRPGLSSLPPRGPHHLDNSSPGPGSETRGINGGPSRMSPKAQRPLRGAKTLSSPSSRPSGEASVPPPPAVGRMYPPRSPKSAAPAPISASCPEPPIGSAVPTSSASIPVTSSVGDPGVGSISPASPKISLAPTDVKELPAKEPGRTLESQELSRIAGKVPGLQNEQKRFQLEELRKFGAQFKLQPSSSPETSLDPFPPRILKEEAKGKEKEVDSLLASEPMGSPVSSKTESISDKEDKSPLPPAGGAEGPDQPPPPCPSQTSSPPVGLIKGDDKDEGPVAEQVKKSTLNPNAKEFNPTKPLLSVNKSTSTPTSPGPRTHSTPSIPVLTAGQSGLYSPQYISYIPQIHMGPAVQAPQMYPYPVSNSVPGQQGKYRGAKGSLPPQRSDQHQPASAPPMMQAAAAAGPPLVAATPYSSYIPYNPQQFPGQPAMMQPMAHYPSQPVFAPMLQSNPRMLTSGSHPQAIVSSSTPQYPSAEQPTPQALYAPGGAGPTPGQWTATAEPVPPRGPDRHATFSAAGTFCAVPSEQLPPASRCVCYSCPPAAAPRLHQHGPCYPGPCPNWNHSSPAPSPWGSPPAPGDAAAPTPEPWGPPPRRGAPEWGACTLSFHTLTLSLHRTPPSSQ